MFFILLENCIKLYNAFNVEEYAAAAIFIDALSCCRIIQSNQNKNYG
jgi:hypothetical protein